MGSAETWSQGGRRLSGGGHSPDSTMDTLKVMLVGDSGVGKTCLLVRFKDGAFLAGTFISTVGIDFRNKVLNVDGVKVKLQIWDTAGQERFRSVTHAYYRDAHALLLLYDVTNRASFDNIQAWLTEIHEYAQKDVVLMLLGNKVDSTQERVVKREDGEKLAKVSTSSRHGFGQEWRIGNRSISKVFSESPRWGQQQLWIMSSLVIWSFPRSETQHIHKYQILIAVTYLGPK
ncbi:ras-related protein Rab-26 isoform X4 [Sminthopsis crassicaudata]|uniref:ras-related protein Rab-26 isoform X4 n=1 Tax=Sminthopsis crassicaudata TaxID=9301 RepID=UPI003D691545